MRGRFFLGQITVSDSRGIKVYEYTPSGGVLVSGTAEYEYVAAGTNVYEYVASGGVTVSGAALIAIVKNFVSSGGVSLGGLALIAITKAYQGSGGLSPGGSAQYNKNFYSGDGGLIPGGSADTSFTSGRGSGGRPWRFAREYKPWKPNFLQPVFRYSYKGKGGVSVGGQSGFEFIPIPTITYVYDAVPFGVKLGGQANTRFRRSTVDEWLILGIGELETKAEEDAFVLTGGKGLFD